MSKKKPVKAVAATSRPVRIDEESYRQFVDYCNARGLIVSRHIAFALTDYVRRDAAQLVLTEGE